MINEINTAVDKFLDMDPDPIPRFVLLKEFKNATLNDPGIADLY